MPHWQARLAATAAEYRRELVQRGFETLTEDTLRGPIPIPGLSGRPVDKTFTLRLPPGFPFDWPRVSLPSEAGKLTWHLNPGGELCLFRSSDNPSRPWETVEGLFARVWRWHECAAAGWPDDQGDPDLERYFERHMAYLITYDSDEHPTGQLVGIDENESDWRHLTASDENRKARRRDHTLWWFGADIGVLDAPIWNWTTLIGALPADDAAAVQESGFGGDGVLLVHYARESPHGPRGAAIALYVQAPKASEPRHAGRVTTKAALPVGAEPTVTTLTIADDSDKARWYRAGEAAERLAAKHVALVGCGAIGSFTADALARSGVGRLTLVDGDVLLPGNCVRHLASREHVPKTKVEAVRDCLVSSGLMADEHIQMLGQTLDPDTALELLTGTDLVIDATANAGVTGLLRDLVDQLGRLNFIKVSLHRDGGLARVDRFGQGTRPDDDRPPFIAELNVGGPTYREAGCGDPVSPTPPTSVLQAAILATRFSADYLQPSNRRQLPDSYVEVVAAQPDPPWTTIGPVDDALVAQPTKRPRRVLARLKRLARIPVGRSADGGL